MTPEDIVAEEVFEVNENFAELLEESIGDKNFEEICKISNIILDCKEKKINIIN